MDQCANFVRTGLGASVCAVPSGDRSRLRRQGLCQDKAPGANGAEPVEHLGGDLQHPRPGMPDHLAREVKQTPAYGGHFVPPPVRIECGLFEQDEQVVRDDADAEEGGIGGKLPAGHALHAEADLQFLDPVLGDFAALAIPDQSVGRRFDAIAGDDVVPGVIIEQFGLSLVLDDDQPEGLLGVVHAVHGFGDGTVRIVRPIRIGDSGNGFLRGSIQTGADGKGLAGVFTVSAR